MTQYEMEQLLHHIHPSSWYCTQAHCTLHCTLYSVHWQYTIYCMISKRMIILLTGHHPPHTSLMDLLTINIIFFTTFLHSHIIFLTAFLQTITSGFYIYHLPLVLYFPGDIVLMTVRIKNLNRNKLQHFALPSIPVQRESFLLLSNCCSSVPLNVSRLFYLTPNKWYLLHAVHPLQLQ